MELAARDDGITTARTYLSFETMQAEGFNSVDAGILGALVLEMKMEPENRQFLVV